MEGSNNECNIRKLLEVIDVSVILTVVMVSTGVCIRANSSNYIVKYVSLFVY